MYIRIIPTDGPGHTNNSVSFQWVHDQVGFREWMQKLHWMPAAYNIGYETTYAVVLVKMGVFVNLQQNTACKAREGWMPVADGMKAVSEIAHEGALDLQATLKALSDAKKRSGNFWTFQLLVVKEGTVDRWLFRHNASLEGLEGGFSSQRASCSSGMHASKRLGDI